MPRQRSDDPLDQAYRERLRDLVLLRKAELEAGGDPITYDQMAQTMGEFGREAVLRIVKRERPVTLSLVERIARGLRMDFAAVLEELTGNVATTKRSQAAAAGYLSLVAAFGVKAAGHADALRAARAIADLDDVEARRWLAQVVEGYAANHQRMTRQRRALERRPAVDQEEGQ